MVDTESAPEITVGLHDVAELAPSCRDAATEEITTDDEPSLGPDGARAADRRLRHGRVRELPSAAELDDIEDEMFRFARVVESTPALRSALTDRSIDSPVRRAGRRPTCSAPRPTPPRSGSSREALRGRTRDLVATLDWLVMQAAQARGWRVARVRAARDRCRASAASLAGALERLAGTPVELQVFVDENLLGGATVQIGDLLVDATIRHRLEQLQEHLLGAEGETRGAQT